MPKYFNYFPTTYYNFDDTNNYDLVTNILSKVSFENDFVNNTAVFYDYLVTDGETPEIVAHKVYGAAERHWIILSFNNITNPYLMWPMDQNTFDNYIDTKYQAQEYANSSTQYAGTSWAKLNNYIYYKVDTKTDLTTNDTHTIKIQVDANTYVNVATSSSDYTLDSGTIIRDEISKETVSYYDYEVELNERKRSIKILKPEFISLVEEEFKKTIA